MKQKTDTLQWVLPQQHRSQETLERLCQAAERLLEDKSFEQISVEEIAREAGSSVGGFYARFPDKDALFACLYDSYEAELRATVDEICRPERWLGVPLKTRVEALVTFGMQANRDRSGFFRAMLMHIHTHPAPEGMAQALKRSRLFGKIRELLLECRDEMTHPDPELAITIGFFSMTTTLQERSLFPKSAHSVGLDVSDDILLHEMTRAFLAYVGARPDTTDTDDKPTAAAAILEGHSSC